MGVKNGTQNAAGQVLKLGVSLKLGKEPKNFRASNLAIFSLKQETKTLI